MVFPLLRREGTKAIYWSSRRGVLIRINTTPWRSVALNSWCIVARAVAPIYDGVGIALLKLEGPEDAATPPCDAGGP
jgi:hypothetical protein